MPKDITIHHMSGSRMTGFSYEPCDASSFEDIFLGWDQDRGGCTLFQHGHWGMIYPGKRTTKIAPASAASAWVADWEAFHSEIPDGSTFHLVYCRCSMGGPACVGGMDHLPHWWARSSVGKLMRAVAKNDREAVRQLLEQGVNPLEQISCGVGDRCACKGFQYSARQTALECQSLCTENSYWGTFNCGRRDEHIIALLAPHPWSRRTHKYFCCSARQAVEALALVNGRLMWPRPFWKRACAYVDNVWWCPS